MDIGRVPELPTGVDRKVVLRVLFALVVLSSGGTVAVHAFSADSAATLGSVHSPEGMDGRLTVVTNHFEDDRKGSIAAFNATGGLVYRNETYTRYFDVDPAPGSNRTVTYVAEQSLEKTSCGIAPWASITCLRQVVERLDLRTDETTVLFDRVIKTQRHDGWHDVDRVGPTSFAVADLFEDRAFVVNTTSGLITWEWAASGDFPLDSGGPDKGDWTHINDVELVRGDDFMLSLRNHDQVVFVDRETGLLRNWTLGTDDDHSVLNEQHNADYIPESRGGPAVIVADSENNRIVEYRRVDDEWRRSWIYTDARMEWPRDADRLPNGNTLVTDTHTNRIMEINGSGDVVWQVSYPWPYEAERLGTGDESAGGHSASELEFRNVTVAPGSAGGENGDVLDALGSAIESVVPPKVRHGLLWLLPPWATFSDVLLLGVCGLTLLAWILAELRWTDRVRFRWPVVFDQ